MSNLHTYHNPQNTMTSKPTPSVEQNKTEDLHRSKTSKKTKKNTADSDTSGEAGIKDKIFDTTEEIKKKASEVTEAAKEKTSAAAEAVKNKASAATETVKDKASAAAESVKQKASDIGESTKEAYDEGTTKASEIVDATTQKVKETYQSTSSQLVESFKEHPLLFTVGAAAVGFLIGLSIPQSRRERNAVSAPAAALREKGEEVVARAKEAVEAATDSAMEAVRERNLDTDGIQESAEYIGKEATDAAKESMERG